MNIQDLRGCGTALVTPFNKDLSINEAALRAFVEWQIAEGINFLVPCGTTGETPTLTNSEQHRVVEIVLETAGKRVPVIAGAGGNNTAAIIEKAREYERLGVDGLLSVTPYYNKPTQEGLFQHYRAIAESTNLPIIVYNVPPRTNVNLLPDTLLRIAEFPNIVGVKEASGDISQITDIAIRMPEDFLLLSGDDSMTLPLVAVGGCGLISVASNEIPRQMTQLTKACNDGDYAEARRLNAQLMPLMKANFIETSPAPVKAALAMMGKIEETARLPIVPVSEATREKLRKVLVDLQLI
ncbi:MAG: 4-hydroxy-tetrahydrodipicolinate synthase [Acidobacteriota bacterium]